MWSKSRHTRSRAILGPRATLCKLCSPFRSFPTAADTGLVFAEVQRFGGSPRWAGYFLPPLDVHRVMGNLQTLMREEPGLSSWTFIGFGDLDHRIPLGKRLCCQAGRSDVPGFPPGAADSTGASLLGRDASKPVTPATCPDVPRWPTSSSPWRLVPLSWLPSEAHTALVNRRSPAGMEGARGSSLLRFQCQVSLRQHPTKMCDSGNGCERREAVGGGRGVGLARDRDVYSSFGACGPGSH